MSKCLNVIGIDILYIEERILEIYLLRKRISSILVQLFAGDIFGAAGWLSSMLVIPLAVMEV